MIMAHDNFSFERVTENSVAWHLSPPPGRATPHTRTADCHTHNPEIVTLDAFGVEEVGFD